MSISASQDNAAAKATPPQVATSTSGLDVVSHIRGQNKPKHLPWGAKWRASDWFMTAMVGLALLGDTMAYAILVPILPFRLESLGYATHKISRLTSYLLISYTIGSALSGPVIAFFFHRYPYRRAPLVGGTILLQLCLVWFMLAKPFWCLVMSRILQGVASAIVWVVGLAILNENVSAKRVGLCSGIARSGVNLGITTGTSLGGFLYDRLGWYAPSLAIIIVLGVDALFRALILERRSYPDLDNQTSEESKTHSNQPSVDPEGVGGATSIPCQNSSSARVPAANLSPTQVRLSPWKIVCKVFSSPRTVSALATEFCCLGVYISSDVVITLRFKDIWHKDSSFVGLVYLGAAGGTVFSVLLAGRLTDRIGSAPVICGTLILAIPWVASLLVKTSVVKFAVFFCLYDTFSAGIWPATGTELAAVGKSAEGISEIHQFAASNLMFGIGATVWPLIISAIYDRLSATYGWTLICLLWVGVLAFPLPLVVFSMGEVPVAERLLRWRRQACRKSQKSNTEEVAG